MENLNLLQNDLDYIYEINNKLCDVIRQNKTKMDEIWDNMNTICLNSGICINCRKKMKGTGYSICLICDKNNRLESYEDYKYW